MSHITVPNCDEIDDAVMRYAYGSKLSGEERSQVEEHLKGCTSCRELVFFVRKTRALARQEPIRFGPPTEPCLETDTFIALKDHTLDEAAARQAKLHLLACPSCREVFLMLQNLNEQADAERIADYLDAPRITEVVVRLGKQVKRALQKARDKMLEVVQISGEGRILDLALEPTRGEQPAGAAAEAQIAIADTVTDTETGLTSSIRITVAADEEGNATLHIASDPPQETWTVSFAGADGTEIKSASLAKSRTLSSGLPMSAYIATVSAGERRLATFSIELRS